MAKRERKTPARDKKPSETTPAVRVIKRYSNRKLYDTEASSYVTLDDIAGLVKDGDEVRVIDNKTKEDLTALTLTQIIFEEEKRQKRVLPLSTLRGVIQSGGEFLQRHIADPVSSMREEAERTMASLRGEAERTVTRLVKADAVDEVRDLLRELLENTQHTYDDIQKRIDERFRVVLGNVAQFSTLCREIETLKKKVATLEQRAEEDAS